MPVPSIGIEQPLDIAIQRPQHADPACIMGPWPSAAIINELRG
jgi:hypothetical protein